MNRQAPIDAGPTRRTMSNRDKGLLLGSLALLLGGLVFLIVSLVGSDSSDTKIATGTTTVSATQATGGTGATAAASFTEPAPIIGSDGSVTYVIPAGTWARKKAGEAIAVIPEKITIKVGQRLILRNDDSGAHIAGPFFVGAGETSTYSSTEPKVVEGECTIHPAGKFEIDVVA